jgi:hypothetical protein
VLRPNGRMLFIEHLRSENERWARWQDRLEKPWAALADGCHCNRTTLELFDHTRLRVEHLERENWGGMPRVVRPLAIGRAQT